MLDKINEAKAQLKQEQDEVAESKKWIAENRKDINNIMDSLADKEAKLAQEQDDMEAELKAKSEQLEAEYNKKEEEARVAIEEAMVEAEEAIRDNIIEMDEIIKNRLAEVAATNTVTFTCACSDKPIPCTIDFTKDNTFRCPDCSAVYRVDIRMNPVLIGKDISDEEYIAKIQQHLKENEQL